MAHRLFEEAALFYDLHTPPNHYRHDHEFVLEELAKRAPGKKILDVGCGTGVFLDKATQAGFEGHGLDISPQMVEIAAPRTRGKVVCRPMQSLSEVGMYDAIVSLSWSFNYCKSVCEAQESLRRFHQALTPGGLLVLQVAHAAHASGSLMEDREPGPDGQADDVLFLYKFSCLSGRPDPTLKAEYVFACRSAHQLVMESHLLHAADVQLLEEMASEVGFAHTSTFNSCRRDPLTDSVSPFLTAQKA